MAYFEIAVAKTLMNEGGAKYTETKGDHGGATKYGISLKFLSRLFLDGKLNIEFKGHKVLTNETIKNLTEQEAKNIYKEYFWDVNRYGDIEDQYIANKVFDLSVLFGAPCSNRMLQRALNISDESVDGIIGDKTLNICDSVVSIKGNCLTIDNIKTLFTHYCVVICNKDKTQTKFLLGWLNRVLS